MFTVAGPLELMLVLDLPLHPARKRIAITIGVRATVKKIALLRIAEPPRAWGRRQKRGQHREAPVIEQHSSCLSCKGARTRLNLKQVIAFRTGRKRVNVRNYPSKSMARAGQNCP